MTDYIAQQLYNMSCAIRQLQNAQPTDPLTLPPGGDDGDVLIKQGDDLGWGSPSTPPANVVLTTIPIDITTDGQTVFTNVIPVGKNVWSLSVDGDEQIPGVDWIRQGSTQNISWISSDALLAELDMTISVY